MTNCSCDDGLYCDEHLARDALYWLGEYQHEQRTSQGLTNENGHTYGCGCTACIEEYRRLKR